MFLKRFSSLTLVAAIVIAVAGSGEPALCSEAATQEKNLALLKVIEANLAKKPGDVELLCRHMQALGIARLYQDELREAEALITKYPRLRAAYKGQMFALVGLRNWTGALAAMDKVTSLGALSPSELATRGAILAALGRYPQALSDVNESILRDSTDAGSFFTRADCLYKMNGPSAEVVGSLEQTLKLDPNFPNARKLLDFMTAKLSSSTARSSR